MITRIVKFKVRPEQTEAFKSAFADAKVGAEQEPEFEEARLFVDNNDPKVFFAYERLKDQAAAEHHAAQPHTEKLFAYLGSSGTQVEQFDLGDTNPPPDHSSKQPNPEDEVFVVFFIFKIRSHFRDRLLKQFETHIKRTREDEVGCIIFDLYTVDGDQNTLAVYEHWRKESDVWDIHFNQPYAVETGNLMKEAVIGNLEQYMHFVTEVA